MRPGFPASVALALLLTGAPAAFPQDGGAQGVLAARIERIITRPEFRHSHWGILFQDLETGRPLYTLNEQKLFIPGSTTKLLASGTALQYLGADHRFRTRIYRTAPVSANGTLQGDLILVAAGDPNLSQRLQPDGSLAFTDHDHSYGGAPDTRAVPGNPLMVLDAMAAQVAAKGIRRVTGRVLVDVSLYREGVRELGSGVVISPISVNDNVVDVTVSPGATIGAPAHIEVSPPTGYIRIANKVTTAAAGSRPSIDMNEGQPSADGSRSITITGSFPAATAGVLYTYRVPVPSRFAEFVLREALQRKGVTVGGAPGGEGATLPATTHYTEANVVAEHRSAPASEMVKVVLKVSQNMHASSLPFLLGALHGGGEKNGFDLAREWLAREGLALSGAQQGDGAGGDAHFTPAFMVSFLELMSRRADFPAFHAALPILGRDGTLAAIQPESPAAGKVHAKTGTFVTGDPLNRGLLLTAKGLAGYLTTASGRRVAFAVYVNHVPLSSAPDEVTRVAGQALGEVAAAVWDDR